MNNMEEIIVEEVIEGFIPDASVEAADENTMHYDGEMEEI
jgi:hypothetical protein